MEKAAAKVGVVLQSVKEVLLGMVADDLVHEDRIGASKYYWAFPSEHATKVRGRPWLQCARSPATGRPGDTFTCCTCSLTAGPSLHAVCAGLPHHPGADFAPARRLCGTAKCSAAVSG